MCLSLAFAEQLIVWLIIVVAIVAIIRLLVPMLDALTGLPTIGQIINIILWVIVAVALVYIIFGLLSCLFGGGHLTLPHVQ